MEIFKKIKNITKRFAIFIRYLVKAIYLTTKNFLDKWLVVLMFAVVLDVLLTLTVVDVDWFQFSKGELIFGIATVFVLMIYALDTRSMSIATQLSVSPNVSLKVKTGKKYKDMSMPIEWREDNFVLDTRFILKNHSKLGTKAYVNLNLKVGRKKIEYHPKYSGKEAWPLEPEGSLDGHIYLVAILEKAGTNFKKMLIETGKGEDVRKLLTMEIEVENEGVLKKRIKNFPQKWSYDFKKLKWENTDYYYHAEDQNQPQIQHT